ncbi:unnamed protein product [Dovyalis caffra]|uniref:non-specific serine/threonine protein kinase n=1 Tax=Dovyalis caffra TaxID=77055 RepID=A0AAV1QS05_9ROSI|nr:unnamed protein product [Dovyalis caffra]
MVLIIQSSSSITIRTTLSASNPNQTWSSPNNTFYVGFSQVGYSSSYTLSTNYNGGVPIWKAGNTTTTVDSKGSFQFLSSGNLGLLNGSGAIVWDSNTARLAVTTASLDDFGKLVLQNGTLPVWSSFDNPTATIVPNQTFSVNQVLRSGSYSSRFLRLNSYVDANLTSPTLGLQPIGILTIFDVASGSYIVAYSIDYGEGITRLRFLRLDKDRNLRMHSTDIVITSQVRVQFVVVRLRILSLLMQMIVDKPETVSQVFFVGISACRLNCLSQGSACIASTSLSDGTGLCYLKNPGFIGGYKNLALPSTSYVKVYGPEQPNPTPGLQNVGKSNSWRLHIWVLCVVVVITLLGLIAVLSAQYALLEYESGAPVQFSYKDLQRSTREFKEKLGAGGHRTLTSVRGTRGYLAPEWLANLPITSKSDILRLWDGFVGDISTETNRKKFSIWAYEEFEKGTVNAILDQRLTDQDVDMQQVKRVIQVSFWCIQEQPSQRPMMGKVVQMLEGISEIVRPPAPKAITEGSISGNNINVSSNVSPLSTFVVSAPAPSSSSSYQTIGVSPLASVGNTERTSSS